MKKIICAILFIFFGYTLNVNAMSYEEALNNSHKKPMLIFIYASWAENLDNCWQNFKTVQGNFSDDFNYVVLNIASKNTKAFSEKYQINPKLPYVLMFKNSGTISRYIDRQCLSSPACFTPKIQSLLH